MKNAGPVDKLEKLRGFSATITTPRSSLWNNKHNSLALPGKKSAIVWISTLAVFAQILIRNENPEQLWWSIDRNNAVTPVTKAKFAELGEN